MYLVTENGMEICFSENSDLFCLKILTFVKLHAQIPFDRNYIFYEIMI